MYSLPAGFVPISQHLPNAVQPLQHQHQLLSQLASPDQQQAAHVSYQQWAMQGSGYSTAW